MFPGSDAGQELVLHTLEQIPEDERLQNTNTQITNHQSCISYFHLFFFMDLNSWNVWSQDLEGGSKEETGKATKVSDLRDWGGREEVVLMQVAFVLTDSLNFDTYLQRV